MLVVGTQINGTPHVGTSLVQSLAFAMAARLRDCFGIQVPHPRRPRPIVGAGAADWMLDTRQWPGTVTEVPLSGPLDDE
ncbi:hypothetical protein [Streptomyces blattellae]|uniref:hypothetical protein n=1 Tax=Streptomyces blattellae TaxID=2569855 RepID=UPI0012B8B783|nr:hypothetical protein [Streptomyces blattellae]